VAGMTDQKVYLISHHEVTKSRDYLQVSKEQRKKFADFYKIGIAEKPEKRLSTLSSGTPHELELVTTIQSDSAKTVESYLHAIYSYGKHNGEWFSLLPNEVNSLKGLDYIAAKEAKKVKLDSVTQIGVDGPSLYVEVMKQRT
jgi:hypothetical protein